MSPIRKPVVAAACLFAVLGLPGLSASAPTIVQAAAALSPVAGSPGVPSGEQLADAKRALFVANPWMAQVLRKAADRRVCLFVWLCVSPIGSRHSPPC